ncbi:MAG: hypothetical protein FWH02_09295 [Oscillospiraceae bacterium]|nr:hypothetical protein [Oscillospiraceae bacterium]
MEVTVFVNGKQVPQAQLKSHIIKNNTVSQIVRNASERTNTAKGKPLAKK